MKTQFEREFGVDLDAPNLDVVKAVQVGIDIEKTGEKFYFSSAKKAGDDLRKFLEFLGKQETEHLQLLSELEASLQQRGHWIKATEKLERPEIFKAGKAPHVTSRSGDLEILMHALEAEKKSRDYYGRFAEHIKDPTGRHFFTKLADFEQGHASMIEAMIDIRSESSIET
jgi:rubrerythrin